MSAISVLLFVLYALLALTVAATIVIAVASFAPFFQKGREQNRNAPLVDVASVWLHADEKLRDGVTDWAGALVEVGTVSVLSVHDIELGIANLVAEGN